MSRIGDMLTRRLSSDAVYWPRPTNDGEGNTVFATPQTLKVRWVDKQEQFVGQDGQPYLSESIVYTLVDTQVGGFLFLGTLADLASGEEADPRTADLAWEIRGIAKIPSLDGLTYLRKALL